MENPRFLLNSTRQFPAGIGNQYDLVGRFFTEHLGYNLGRVIFENGAPRGRSYEPSEALKDANAILNFDLLVKAKRQGFAKELTRTVSCSSEFIERLSVAVLGRRVNCEHSSFGDFFSLITSDDANTGSLGIIIEQALNRDSRILLSDELDAFGQRRIALDWRYSAMDAHTMQTAATLVAQEFAERGVGRVKLKDWLLTDDLAWPQLNDGQGEVALNHHMCTTRMSSDPRQGVVDADCRVHGVSNLYIGGSSVFATAGHANPTYTIVQLALRLGDHLGAQLQG